MPNSMSAEQTTGTQCNPGNPSDVEQPEPLKQQTKPSGSLTQPHLRIVHSADRLEAATSVDMSPPQRNRPAPAPPPAMLDRTVQAQIGRMLRDVFSDIAGEPVPDRFVNLLAELERAEAKEESQ